MNGIRYSISLARCLVLLATYPQVGFAQTGVVADPGLRLAIWGSLGQSVRADEPLTMRDLAGLRELSSRFTIRSLAGLEAATNLVSVSLDAHGCLGSLCPTVAFEDFSPLANLPELRSLSLSRNEIEQLDLSRGFQSLREIDIEGNPLTDLALPATNPFEVLRLGGGLSMSFLAQLNTDNLRVLELTGIEATTLNFDRRMPFLEELTVRSSVIEQFALTHGMNSLRILELSNIQLRDVLLPDDLHSLEQLGLRGNRLTRLLLPDGMVQLMALEIQYNNLKDLYLPATMSDLGQIIMTEDHLGRIVIPEGLDSLISLRVITKAFPDPLSIPLFLPQGLDSQVLRPSWLRVRPGDGGLIQYSPRHLFFDWRNGGRQDIRLLFKFSLSD